MSRGLGKVERTILGALQTTQRPYVALWQLVLVVDGRVQSLDEPLQPWDIPICEPHPRRRLAIGLWVDHDASCYPPRPSRSLQESVSRGVRSLVRKGLVRCEYEGGRLKRLLVYLPSTDPAQLPKAQRWENAVRAHVLFGMPLQIGRRHM